MVRLRQISDRPIMEKRMSDKIIQLSDDKFEADVINAEEVATEFDGKLTVGKLNVDENNETPPKYGIRGIPTLLLFKNGNVAATKVGALSKAQLTEFLNENL